VQLPTLLAGSNPDPDVTSGTTLLSGLVLVVIVVLLPDGIVDAAVRAPRRARRPGTPSPGAVSPLPARDLVEAR